MRHRSYSRFKVWVLPRFLLVFIQPCHIIKTEVTIIKIICRFSSNHWYSKLKFKFAVCPSTKSFNTGFANNMRCPWLALITKFHVKVCFICPFHKVCDVPFLLFHYILSIYVAKWIWMVFGASSRRTHFHNNKQLFTGIYKTLKIENIFLILW